SSDLGSTPGRASSPAARTVRRAPARPAGSVRRGSAAALLRKARRIHPPWADNRQVTTCMSRSSTQPGAECTFQAILTRDGAKVRTAPPGGTGVTAPRPSARHAPLKHNPGNEAVRAWRAVFLGRTLDLSGIRLGSKVHSDPGFG